MLHGPAHYIPRRAEPQRHLGPTHPSGPCRQKPQIGRARPALPFRPRHVFYPNPAAMAVHTPHPVDECQRNLKQRHKCKPPHSQPVITDGDRSASRTQRPAVLSRSNLNLDLPAVLAPTTLFEHEPGDLLDMIQNRLQLHPVLSADAGFSTTPLSRL